MIKKSFAAVSSPSSKILVLGSLPGDRSLIQNQYYAHPQNRFWPTIAQLFDSCLPFDYPKRLAMLHQNRIALWDVCKTAHRKGSMDTDILNEIPNDIENFLESHPNISTIIFNGQKAQKLFDKYHSRRPELCYITLPSTSPANARYTKSLLNEKWNIITNILGK